jgi:hypothetical protein
MDEQLGTKGHDDNWVRGSSPPGLAMPLVLLILTPITWLCIRDSESSKTAQAIVSICVSVMVWICTAIFQVAHRCRSLGWDRLKLARFLSGGRPSDPEELLVWQWVLQLCYAVAAFALCMIALTLLS